MSVSLDPSWDDTLIRDPALIEKCRGVDLFLPNLDEAAAIAGTEDPHGALGYLADYFPVVALKKGADGTMLAKGVERYSLPAPPVGVVDTTGAGDAFKAGFIDAWLSGKDDRSCLEAAIAAGSLSVQAAGDATALLLRSEQGI